MIAALCEVTNLIDVGQTFWHIVLCAEGTEHVVSVQRQR